METAQGKTGKPNPTQPGPAIARLYESGLKANKTVLQKFSSPLCARKAVGVQVIYCHLLQRALLSHQLWTYAPKNSARLLDGQQQTMKSLNKYSFTALGIFSFYTGEAQRLTAGIFSKNKQQLKH